MRHSESEAVARVSEDVLVLNILPEDSRDLVLIEVRIVEGLGLLLYMLYDGRILLYLVLALADLHCTVCTCRHFFRSEVSLFWCQKFFL